MMARFQSRYSNLSPSENSLYYDDSPSTRFSWSENLSNIINVDPCSPPFTCVGWAPSQRRRCENKVAWSNRSYASKLIKEGTIQFLRGEDVLCILKELAPRVLCQNRHQYQAMEMVCCWQKMIKDHLEDQISRELATRRRLLAPLQGTEYLRERDLRSLSRGGASQSPIAGFGLSSAAVHQTEASRTPLSAPALQSLTSSLKRPLQVLETDRRPPSSTAPAAPLVEPSQSGSIPYAVRRQIKLNGGCPICQGHFTPNSTSSLHPRTLNGSNIAWCRARCGTNFHSSCIKEWETKSLRTSQSDSETTSREINCPCWYVDLHIHLLYPFIYLQSC